MKYFIVVSCFIVFSYTQNLLPNPGFESWTAGMPDYWSKDDSILIYQEDVIVHGGNFSVKDSLITQTQDRADFISDTIAVIANTNYTFSIWVFDNDLAARVRQAISWHTGGGWTNTYAGFYSGNMTEWQQLVLTALSPAGADSACVFVRAYDSAATWDGGAVFYLDDASLTSPDMQAPVIVRIWHTPTNPASGSAVTAYAKVSDDGTITADTLFYGVNNLNTPVLISHAATSNDTFMYQIPGQSSGDTVFYFLKFTDDDNLTTFSDTHAYYVGDINIVINEIYYDTPGNDSGAYIEICGLGSASLNGMSLVGVNGIGGSPYATIDLSAYSIPVDGFFVVAQYSWVTNADLVDPLADLQNGPDNVELRFNDVVVDAVGYGVLDGWVFTGEWLPAVDVISGHALGRFPDGDDTDNNLVDFHDYDTLTPGTSNPIVGIEEVSTARVLPAILRNPVRSGVKFETLVNEERYYPVEVFNTLGQHVKTVKNPDNTLQLPAGIYFLRFCTSVDLTQKIVIVQ